MALSAGIFFIHVVKLCMLGNFFMLLLLSVDFYSKLTFLKKLGTVTETITVSNHLDPDQGRHSVGPNLGPNCLQRLSAQTTKVAASKVKLTTCVSFTINSVNSAAAEEQFCNIFYHIWGKLAWHYINESSGRPFT